MNSQLLPNLTNFNTSELKLKGFKVYEIDTSVSPVPSYSRRDFYKICLVTGKTAIYYADKGIEIDGTYLFFGNPHIPYSSELRDKKQSGYACLFTEEFLKASDRSESLQESALFKIGGTPVLSLTGDQKDFATTIFQKMLAEQDTDY